MAKVTQNLKIQLNDRNIYYFKCLFLICLVAVLLYTPEILNTNIEQEYRKMPHFRTSQEIEFLKYFRSINKHTIKNILDR